MKIDIEKAKSEIKVHFKTLITKNESKNSIAFNLEDNVEITNDDVANFLTTLASELLSEEDDFKIEFNCLEKNCSQCKFIIELITSFVDAYKAEYKDQTIKFQNKVKKIKDSI
ncbi:MAG: hypothetical protein Ta2E_07310 [Mycoplasmoidaceae bacterium]|nr:MAG: hypothetical protein Ta2E_07310 [Mycoplasmoidaceae bacterium]